MCALLIGRAKGPGEKTFEYQFITSDKDKVKIGEFIYFEFIDDRRNQQKNEKQKVLSRIVSRTPLRVYPDIMLSNPQIDPAIIASTIDYDNAENMDFYLIDAQIIGFFLEDEKYFINPRISPRPGQPIYLANKEDLTKWINPYAIEESGAAYIGHLLSRSSEQIPVTIDINKLVSTHLAVLAATGSGKSYTVGVILEEMIMPKNKGAILVFDPHDEYSKMKFWGKNKDNFVTDNYLPHFNQKNAEEIKIKLADLSFPELLMFFKNITEKQTNSLREAFNEARMFNPNSFTVQDIKDQLEKIRDRNNENTINAVLWRLNAYLEQSEILDDTKTLKLQEILRPGQMTILNMSFIRESDQQIITSVLLNRILKSRIKYERTPKEKMGNLDDDELLPYPVFIVLEEGHRFAPANDESSSKTVLKTILSEGRKFGIGICIVSQRPGKLDSDVLSQCMAQIIMKIINPVDQKNIKDSVEAVSEDLIEELPGLTRGQALVAGEGINTPVLVQIRERLTLHGGESIRAVERWAEYKPERKVKNKIDNQNESLY